MADRADRQIPVELKVPGAMNDQSGSSIRETLAGLPSVADVRIDPSKNLVFFTYNPAQVQMITIEKALEGAGFPVSPDLKYELQGD